MAATTQARGQERAHFCGGAVRTMNVIGVLGDIEGKAYTSVHLLE